MDLNSVNRIAMEPRLWFAFLEQLRLARDNKITFAMQRVELPKTDTADVVNVTGALMRTVPAAVRDAGIDATGYDEIAEQVNKAAASKSAAVILNVNSPGGLTDGIDQAIMAIRAAKAIKPVYTYSSSLISSAAYWVGSQATQIFTERLTQVGSIGVYSVIYDASKKISDEGMRVLVARSGDLKGPGILGDPVTDKMLAVEQEIVDDIAQKFINDVIQSRPFVDAEAIATGRLWMADASQALGLIDAIVADVRDIPQTLTALKSRAQTEQKTKENKIMPTEKTITLTLAVDGEEEEVEVTEASAEAEPEPEPEAEEDEEEEVASKAMAKERKRVMAIAETFADDQTFARKHINAGSTLDKAKAEYFDTLKARTAALATLEGGTPLINKGTPATNKEDYYKSMYALAKQNGIPLYKAAEMIARENPTAYRNAAFGG